ncbi:MAG: DUF4254 domain-containing protein [Flavobacteriales bacterium]
MLKITAQFCSAIFKKTILDYHTIDHVDAELKNPYPQNSMEHILYNKAWIDTVQWHLEDIIRDPQINPIEALQIKRRIDTSNQERTDMVEKLDDKILAEFANVIPAADAKLNTESVGWAIDRLSILCLKLYHMQEQAERIDTNEEHKSKCAFKLRILQEQEIDLSLALNQLVEDIAEGKRKVKVYRQMKMYNDESLNPILYNRQK